MNYTYEDLIKDDDAVVDTSYGGSFRKCNVVINDISKVMTSTFISCRLNITEKQAIDAGNLNVFMECKWKED